MVLITAAVEIGTEKEKVNHANEIGKTMPKPKSDTATKLNQN